MRFRWIPSRPESPKAPKLDMGRVELNDYYEMRRKVGSLERTVDGLIELIEINSKVLAEICSDIKTIEDELGLK